jgi:hypothetical protein
MHAAACSTPTPMCFFLPANCFFLWWCFFCRLIQGNFDRLPFLSTKNGAIWPVLGLGDWLLILVDESRRKTAFSRQKEDFGPFCRLKMGVIFHSEMLCSFSFSAIQLSVD